MVVSLVCTASLGFLGHQVVIVVVAVEESKVTREAQERLDPKEIQELLVSVTPRQNVRACVNTCISGLHGCLLVSACCCESAAATDERKKDRKYKTGM